MTVRQFFHLMRPHTLVASLAPVSVGLLLAGFHQSESFNWGTASLTLLVAICAQILSNVLNDWYDYKQGADSKERQGFERPLSTGSLTPRSVKSVMWFWLIATAMSGLLLLYLTSWTLIWIGVLVLLVAWGYTAGKYSIAYIGGGELAVLIFFGWIAVLVPYYIQTEKFSLSLFLIASSMGLASVNILLVNNYRDYEEDKKSGKRTLIVRWGKELAPRLYLTDILLSIFLLYPIHNSWSILASCLYIWCMLRLYKKFETNDPQKLNTLLAQTSLCLLLLILVVVASFIPSI